MTVRPSPSAGDVWGANLNAWLDESFALRDANLTAHTVDTTAVHGITDTAVLETQAGATAKVTAHTGAAEPHAIYEKIVVASTTVVHGAVAGTARPANYFHIQWIGSVEPTNAINFDTWVDTT